MLNRVILEGRLGANPVEYKTPSGKVYTYLSLPLFNPFQRDRNSTEWMQCEVWGKSAEFMINNAKKGMTVSVEGRLRNRKHVNSKGETRYITYVATDQCNLHRERRITDPGPAPDLTPEEPTLEEQPLKETTTPPTSFPPRFDPNYDPFA